MFTVYSYMFRLTRVFRLELYCLRGHCAYSGIPDAYLFYYIDVIYCITHIATKQKPLTLLPINTSRVISYNTITMTFVTTFSCNTTDNIYVKIM